MAAESSTGSLADRLVARFASADALVGVVGLGYVGLPILLAFHACGFRTLGFDIDATKIERLNRGESYMTAIPSAAIAALAAGGRFEATGDFDLLSEPDAILICVPTPLTRQREPDLSHIVHTAQSLRPRLRRGQLVVLESTSWPGTTESVLKPLLEQCGLRSGEDFLLAYSPEREDPGNTDFTTARIPRIVAGDGAEAARAVAALYGKAVERVVPVSSLATAEAVKLTENIFRSVNIALVNELKQVYQAMGIDIWEVIDAAGTKPFGYMPFYPGPGLGGHCIPIDPYYLTWKARELGLPTRFIELAGEVNRSMPEYVVQKTALALNDRGKPVKGSRLLILGLAYKPDVDDVRESPSFALIEQLESLGAVVDYNDPHVPATHKMRRHDLQRTSVPLTPQSLAGYDAVLIATNHTAYDWQMIADHAALIIDTRDAMRHVKGRRDHIVKA
jgi:UDP-N-acetyl-D-glucosamine dehydrogenase